MRCYDWIRALVILALVGYFGVLAMFWAFPRGGFSRILHNQTVALSFSHAENAGFNSSLQAGNLDGPSTVRSLPNAAMERTSVISESSTKVLACVIVSERLCASWAAPWCRVPVIIVAFLFVSAVYE
jgi:hypothetical protein